MYYLLGDVSFLEKKGNEGRLMRVVHSSFYLLVAMIVPKMDIWTS